MCSLSATTTSVKPSFNPLSHPMRSPANMIGYISTQKLIATDALYNANDSIKTALSAYKNALEGQGDLAKAKQVLAKAQSHLNEAQENYDSINRMLDKFLTLHESNLRQTAARLTHQNPPRLSP